VHWAEIWVKNFRGWHLEGQDESVSQALLPKCYLESRLEGGHLGSCEMTTNGVQWGGQCEMQEVHRRGELCKRLDCLEQHASYVEN